jgi:subtilisin-like proprotein convertase family protein
MRLKPFTWFLVSLLLFVAAICMWQYGGKYANAHRPADNHAAATRAGLASRPPLIKTGAAKKDAKRKSYRISNTTQSLAKLLHNSHALILRNALIDTEIPVALDIPAHLRAKGAPGSYLVQADRALDKGFYAELGKAGVSYVSYIPNNAALVKASPEQATNLAANADIIAVLPYEPYYKLDGSLLPSAVEQQPSAITNLSVTTFAGQRDATLAALTGLGATLIGEDRTPFGPTLIVSIPPGSLTAIAQLPLAQEIEACTPRHLANDLARVQLGVSADTLTNTSNYLGLSGLNVTVNINDTGVDSSHPDFAPTSRLFANTNDYWALIDYDGHGTHVAGIIAGNGSKSGSVSNHVPGSIIPGADFRGKATNAILFSQTLDLGYGPYSSDSFLQANASSNLGPTNLISNNSWGYGTSEYDIHAASFDAATRDAQPNVDGEQPLLFVFAAGNSGNGNDNGVEGAANTISSPGTAKNVITVGASDSPRFITNMVSYDSVTTNEVFFGATDNSNLVAWFSSCGNVGPGLEGTYGRFKPDMVAPGVFTISCRAKDYVDPTNETTVYDYPNTNQVVKPGMTNVYPFPLDTDTSGLVIIISSNALSPRPFPHLTILGDTFNPPTDILSTNDFLNLTNITPGGFWYFGVVAPSNAPGPVNYDINFYLYDTNSEGDYYTVLSNMNSVLAPWYRYESGTSMSAGAVSGMLALMQEYLQKHTPFTNPSPALLKAMLINGCRSLGPQYDFYVNNPSANEQGWGLPNITNSIPLSFTNASPSVFLLDQSTSNALATGQYQTYQISCSDSNAGTTYPLRVTLVWTDPPGDPAAGVALVNNLELTVADNSGTNIYIGNDFLSGDVFTEPSGITNLPAGESDNTTQNVFVNSGTQMITSAGDSINNVQNVYINPNNVPIQFPLTVTISGTRVNVNAVPGQTNNIMQDYALVVSTDDPSTTNTLTVTPGVITAATNIVLITVASNGVPLLHERVGANEPNLYLSNGIPSATNGNLSQWHFFIFTNDQFSTTNQATNVAFATFMPPNLSIPRATSADIDMYVSTNSDLTNLIPSVVQAADKSLGPTGTESVIYTNSSANKVYYTGIKSEDQQGADFGFYGIAQQAPFSTTSGDGDTITATGTSLPVYIPNAVAYRPALAFAFVLNPNPLAQYIRTVTPTVGIQQGDAFDLYGTLQHNGITSTLNHDSGAPGGFTNTYDDLQEDPSAHDALSDGPGNLTQYIQQSASGLWLLTEADNALAQTGQITQYTMTVELQQPQVTGFYVTIPANSWFDDYVVVPNDATNMIISALYGNSGTNGSGPVGIYLTNNVGPLSTSDYGSNGIVPPGGSLTLSTNTPVPFWPGAPPLAGGTWEYGIYNNSSSAVTLFVKVTIQESLTPNLVQNYTNNAPVNLTTDGHTQSQICITSGQQLVDLQIGLCVNDTNLDNLAIHLTSPEGTTVMLFEDRGGIGASNLGMANVITNGTNTIGTNYIYTVFTENTNLAQSLIKFAQPPYASSNFIAATNISSNSFENLSAGIYTNGTNLAGWLVTSNIVAITTTNGLSYLTNNSVGIVTDTNGDMIGTNSLGSNYLALTSGRIVQTFSNLIPNATYQIQYYARGPGIVDWWPANDNTDDIIGTNNGMIPYNGVTYDVGAVDRAFTFSGVGQNPDYNNGNEVDFGTNVGNFGTNNFTVDFWIKQPPSVLNEQALLEKKDQCGSPYDACWEIEIGGGPAVGWANVPPGHLKALMFSDGFAPGTFQNIVANTPINDGVFHHVALVRNGLNLSFYIDGILDSTNTSASVIANINNLSTFRAGQNKCVAPGVGAPDGSQPFIGDLDEMDLWQRALSPAEIYAIYYAGSLGKYSTNSVLPNFDLTVDGITTNNIILTNAAGGWQLFTNTFVPTNAQVTVEFSGNPLSVLLDDIQIVQLPTTNYNNYYQPEEPLTPFIGQNPLGCWTLDIWDTRNDAPATHNGTLLSWTMQATTSSTNATLIVLTNRVAVTNAVTNGNMTYFAVDVPPYVNFATNTLTVNSGGPLALYFDQDALPTGGLPGDVLLQGGISAPSVTTNVISAQGAPPPLLPGQRYFLGVLNASGANANFTIEVVFNGATNLIVPLTNAVALTNRIGTNTIGTNGPQYYSFLVPTNAAMVTFQVLNPVGGEVDLYANQGMPLPSPTAFDYDSQNAGNSDQFIVVTTNSAPVPLPVFSTNDVVPTSNTWYLATYNPAGKTNINYEIIATVVTNGRMTLIELTNGIPYTNTATPGYPTNMLYYYNEISNSAGIRFTVTNTTNVGNVELLAGWDVFPTPEDFYSGSFNPGTNAQLVQIGTNSALTNLNGTWYLAVPNTSNTNVSYIIEALNVSGTVTNAPLIVGASVSQSTGSFSMSWAATIGKTYQIEISTNLIQWSTVTNLTPQTVNGTFTDPASRTNQPIRFYRLQEE